MSATTYRIVQIEDHEAGVVLDGFTSKDGDRITNPFFGPNGFDQVDPKTEYGEACVEFLARHPDALIEIESSVDLAYAIEVIG